MLPPMWVGFWVQNSLNKDPFLGRFSLRVGFPEIGSKVSGMGSFPRKFIIRQLSVIKRG